MLRWFGVLSGFKYVILRYFNVCGADSNGVIGDSKKPSQLLMQNSVRGAMGIEPFQYTCPVVDTPDGTPIRDYIDVEDLVYAHYLASEYLSDGGCSDTFNLGNGVGYSVKEIVSEVEKLFGSDMEKGQGAQRKGEYARIFANPEKAMRELRWQPQKTLSDSIMSLRKWYTRYPNGYGY
ncbi:UDP-glucose 4-epimerase [Candidatus Magnetobacterium bavaricum]|uniref:UDP-glucose 4-epimerase n=1 Tax=Candidatus Magnetobacterium bavaricum TaxID=29290 RepID=A0A0F3GXJ7_9BACT|nr:UDP-glucose 4-epimerase [Candidatus Magnetobacterium bavaricum]